MGRKESLLDAQMTFILSVQKVPQGTDQGQMTCVSSEIAFFHYRRCMICHKGPVKTTSWASENRLCSPWEAERPKVKAQGNGCVSGLGVMGLLTLLRPSGHDSLGTADVCTPLGILSSKAFL